MLHLCSQDMIDRIHNALNYLVEHQDKREIEPDDNIDKDLFSKLQLETDFKLKQELRSKIFNRHILLLASTVNKYSIDSRTDVDSVTSACIGMLNAIDHFDVNRGVKFSSFAVECMKNSMARLTYIESLKYKASNYNTISLESQIADLEDTSGLSISDTFSDISTDPDTLLNRKTSKEIAIKEVIAMFKENKMKLSPLQHKVFCLRYGIADGNFYKLSEISKILNISVTAGTTTCYQGKKKLKAYIAKNPKLYELVKDALNCFDEEHAENSKSIYNSIRPVYTYDEFYMQEEFSK